jgi:hypothetical protein
MASPAELIALTQAAIRALDRSIAPHPARHPAETAPPQIVAAGRKLLGTSGRLLSRRPGPKPLLVLHDPVTWSVLGAALSLAYTALNAYDRDLDQDAWDEQDAMEALDAELRELEAASDQP